MAIRRYSAVAPSLAEDTLVPPPPQEQFESWRDRLRTLRNIPPLLRKEIAVVRGAVAPRLVQIRFPAHGGRHVGILRKPEGVALPRSPARIGEKPQDGGNGALSTLQRRWTPNSVEMPVNTCEQGDM